jgi:hypothetical protein
MVAAVVEAVAMAGAVVVVVIHLGEMNLVVARIKATSKFSSVTNMETMQIDVERVRRKRNHTMIV